MFIKIEFKVATNIGEIICPHTKRVSSKNLGDASNPQNAEHFFEIIPVAVIEDALDNGLVREIVVVLRVPNQPRTHADEIVNLCHEDILLYKGALVAAQNTCIEPW